MVDRTAKIERRDDPLFICYIVVWSYMLKIGIGIGIGIEEATGKFTINALVCFGFGSTHRSISV